MSAPDQLTILQTKGRLPATKTIGTGPDGCPAIIAGYGNAKRFSLRQLLLGGLIDLAAALAGVRWNEFVMRGEPEPWTDRHDTVRRLHPDPVTGEAPTFREVPRRYLLLDVDRLPAPRGLDPLDGASAAAIARTTLPPEFHPAGCWWQLTSGAGIKPGLNLRLAFWLDRSVGQSILDRWLAGAPVDASVFRPVQPIYVAPPILKGVADPVPVRTGLLRGRDDTVAVPDLPPVTPKIAHPTHSPEGRRYVSGGSRGTAARRLAGLCRAVARAAPGSRHRCLVWAAARAVELDDALSRAEIATELLAAARTAGLEDSDAELQRQIKSGFRLGIFGTGASA